jgi:Tol biopolymer transport system component
MVARRIDGPVGITGTPSWDGRYLSTEDWRTGDLAVFDLVTGQIRRLTDKGSWAENANEFVINSTMSPNGKQVAYTWVNYGTRGEPYNLRVIALAKGAKPRILYHNDEVEWIKASDWSPDGKHVLALLSRKDLGHLIALVSIADGSMRVLKTFDWRYPANAGFSPDGQWIVYDFPPAEDSLERDIFVLAVDGSHEFHLVEHPADDSVLGWAPDGKAVLFASDRQGSRDAWLIHISKGKPGQAPEVVKKGIGSIQPMGFTRSGSFYYGVTATANDVYVATLDPATGELLGPAKKISQRFEGNNISPDWSPDGKYLAYAYQRRGGGGGVTPSSSWSLLIYSLATGEERELPLGLTNVSNLTLRWSPDGRSLLAPGRDRKGRKGIYRIDAQTGEITRLVLVDTNLAAWSSHGKAIFYPRRDRAAGITRIMKRDLEAGWEKELLVWESRQGEIAYVRGLAASPDGQHLAFCGPGGLLKVVPTSGGQPRRLYFAKRGGPCSIAWMPDSRHLLFSSLGGGQNNLLRISLEGGDPQKLGLEMPRMGQRGLSVHPDGRRLAFHASSGDGTTEVWVMENFLPELSSTQ